MEMHPTYFTCGYNAVKLETLKPGDMFVINDSFKFIKDAEVYIRGSYANDVYNSSSIIQLTGAKPGDMRLLYNDCDVYLVKDIMLDSNREGV